MPFERLAVLVAIFVVACSEPSRPGRISVPACDPILAGLPPAPYRFYLTDIDSAGLPQSLTFGLGTYPIAAGQLALDYVQHSMLLAFYTDARAPRFGVGLIGGNDFEDAGDGTFAIYGSDSTDVLALVRVAPDSQAVQYESIAPPDSGNGLRGAHVLDYVRCP